jgi:hypothetical protein
MMGLDLVGMGLQIPPEALQGRDVALGEDRAFLSRLLRRVPDLYPNLYRTP